MGTTTTSGSATSTPRATSGVSLPDMSLTSRAMLALGSAYRRDWTQVDGGVLETEMSLLEQLMQAELRGDQVTAMDLFRSVTCNVCLECGQWSEDCTDPQAHEASARRANGDS